MVSPRVLFVACGVLVMVSGCAGDDVTFTDPGTRFEVDSGDEFVVVLDSNATTGFSWQLETQPPSGVLRLVRDVYVDPDTDLVGAAGHQELTFEAVGDGSSSIQLWYIRTFDDPPEPAARARFEVIVGTGESTEPMDPDDEDAISVVELMAIAPSDPVLVRGLLFDDGSGLRLCDALAESFPPQCPGDFVLIANPDDVSADYTVEQGVRWTDRAIVLSGRYADGEFLVVG